MYVRSRAVWRLAVCGAIGAWLLLGQPTVARSQGNLEVGPFRILVSLDVSGEYNDNILLAPRDEQSDFIWTISPGITIELPGKGGALRVGYRADIIEYTDHDELSTVDHTFQAAAQATWGRVNLALTDEFHTTQEFPGFPVPETTVRTERQENLLRFEGEYRVAERWSVGAHYNFLLVNYTDSEFNNLDRQDHTIGGAVFYRVFPKTSVFGQYDYQIIRYDQDITGQARDSDSQFILAGIRGDLTAKTSAAIRGGWQIKDYDSPAVKDFDGPVVEAEIVWKYREPSQLRIYGGRANVESTFEGSNYYIATYGGAELRHYLNPLLLFTVRGLVGTNDYPNNVTIGTETKEREDTFFEAGLSLRYQIRRWVSVELAYVFLRRDSNFPDFDYTNNRVIATIHLTY